MWLISLEEHLLFNVSRTNNYMKLIIFFKCISTNILSFRLFIQIYVIFYEGRNNSNIVRADQINLSFHLMNKACEDKMFLCMNYDRDEMKVADKRNACFAFGYINIKVQCKFLKN